MDKIAKLTDAVERIANILIERRTALSLSLNKCLELEAIITDAEKIKHELGKEKKDGNSTTSD